jgi:uncharacterized protein (TIGR00730 family)
LARELGSSLAQGGHRLVYGGASVGLMGTLADACLAAGGEVVGIIPRSLVDREVAHPGLTETVVVDSLAQRKTEMVARSSAFVTIPGGIGTLDELFEVWTMAHLRLHDSPIFVLDPDGYYDPLVAFLDQAVQRGFVDAQTRTALRRVSSTADLLEQLVR